MYLEDEIYKKSSIKSRDQLRLGLQTEGQGDGNAERKDL